MRAFALFCLLSGLCLALPRLAPAHDDVAVDITRRASVLLHSGSPGTAKAPADSFVLYGGPGTTAGKFQTTMLPSASPDWQGWTSNDRTDGLGLPFAGDFAKLVQDVIDIDECGGNPSPQVSFLDDGTPPSNPSWAGGGTGGSTSSNWSYGVPGGWVVNHTDGVSGGFAALDNEVISPPIAWDLPGTADDAPMGGAFLRFDTWMHLPYQNGIFARFAARSYRGGSWGPWADHGLLLFGTPGEALRQEFDISALIVPEPDSIQVALGVVDLASSLGMPGNDATVSPLFDNVVVGKYETGGPTIVGRAADLFAVGFPESGQNTFLTQASRDNADIRIDMARDVEPSGSAIVRGDSMVVTVVASTPGTTLTSVELVYRLSLNPVFEAAIRANAPVTAVGMGYGGTDAHEGTVAGFPTGVPGEFAFDLADADFMYPGDHLRFYVRATDSNGSTTTWPADTSDFDDPGPPPIVVTCPTPAEIEKMIKDGTWWNFNANGKPTTWTDINDPPPMIVFGGGQNASPDTPSTGLGGPSNLINFHLAMQSLGYIPRVDYEMVDITDFGLSRGLGSSGHGGPTLDQLGSYEVVVILGGTNDGVVLSDGSGVFPNDKSDDLAMLSAWKNLPGARAVIYFGDNLASGLASGSGAGYVANEMGLSVVSADVGAALGEASPRLVPSGSLPGFTQELVAWGGCPSRNHFDHLAPLAGSAGHVFAGTAVAATIVHDRLVAGDRKVDVTIPIGFDQLLGVNGTATPSGIPARAELLDEVLNYIGLTAPSGTATAAPRNPATASLQVLSVTPNPFNPRTTIRFESTRTQRVEVTILDPRGRLVRRLFDHTQLAGVHDVLWDGNDQAGQSVASGLYLVKVASDLGVDVRKVALLR